MKNLSLVTARVVRQNDQYKYKVVGKGEKYLVMHEEGDNAGDKVMEYLSSLAQEPVKIQQVTLLKGKPEIIGDAASETIFQAKIEFVTVDENKGKERKCSETYFVQAETIRQAFDYLSEFISTFISDAAVTSVQRTKIIEVLKDEETKTEE